MRALIISALLGGATVVASLPARAETAQPLLETNGAMSPVLVLDGCGPGFHRGYYGRCRPNFFRGGYGYGYGRPGYGYGYHRNWARHWGF